MSSPATPNSRKNAADTAQRIHRGTVLVLQVVMAVELVLALYERQWATATFIVVIMAVTIAPVVFRERLPVDIPPEFQLLAVIFVFSSLFLGEVRSFYERIWWWDIALHASSGVLLGIVGFLLVYVLNQDDRIDLHMHPRFVALFAFTFAVAVGALWEIYEFAMDQLVGTQMQKPMFNDPSGLTDTMWDLIVDSLGALVISALGWWHMKFRTRSFIEDWILKFIESNPRLFAS
ncbi:MAG: hypothetical protein AMXMBFR4_09390 [Candidatus Hydrogenedentota bacterium]